MERVLTNQDITEVLEDLLPPEQVIMEGMQPFLRAGREAALRLILVMPPQGDWELVGTRQEIGLAAQAVVVTMAAAEARTKRRKIAAGAAEDHLTYQTLADAPNIRLG